MLTVLVSTEELESVQSITATDIFCLSSIKKKISYLNVKMFAERSLHCLNDVFQGVFFPPMHSTLTTHYSIARGYLFFFS